ncbi:hypothetical protein UT300012_32530 [Paraclostridium bifermentans]
MDFYIDDIVKCTCKECIEYNKTGSIIDIIDSKTYTVKFDNEVSYMYNDELELISRKQ